MFLLITTNCENVDVVESGVEYEEKIVVQSELIAEEVFQGVYISRTLPLDEAYDINNSAITDAICYLQVNGLQVIPLHHTDKGLYKPAYDYVIRTGYRYELFGRSVDEKFYASTTIPNEAEIVESVLNDGYVVTRVRSNNNEVYGSKWVIKSQSSENIISQADDYHSITRASSNETTTLIRTANIPDEFLNPVYGDYVYFKVYSFDKQFLEYFKSKNNNNSVDDTFTQAGGHVNWNVKGEKAIGLFIGLNEGPMARVRK